MAVKDLVEKAGLNGSYGGVSVESPGSASAIDAEVSNPFSSTRLNPPF
jgi:hypothetical protein